MAYFFFFHSLTDLGLNVGEVLFPILGKNLLQSHWIIIEEHVPKTTLPTNSDI